MSAANQPYTEIQKDMIQRFNAAIREGPSSLAAPAGSAATVETLTNNIRALKAELDGADSVIKSLKAKPLCPDCDSRMVRMQWQCEDGGWVAGWLCECECNKYGRRIKPQNAQAQPPRTERNQKPEP